MKEALERVENSLDVCQMVNDLNLLKVISHFMLRERHFGLAQLVGFDLWNREKKEHLRSQKEKNSNNLPSMFVQKVEAHDRRRQSKEELLKEKEVYMNMLNEVQKECGKDIETLKNDPSYNPQIHELDKFYGHHLAESSIRLLGLKNSGFSFLENFVSKFTFGESSEDHKQMNFFAPLMTVEGPEEQEEPPTTIKMPLKKEIHFKHDNQEVKFSRPNEKYEE